MMANSKNGQVVSDNAYSAILGYLPNGLIGLSLAALTAAIVASLAGKANSISTIYTLDIYKKYINKEASEQKMVWIGRIAILVAMVLSIALTWRDALDIGGEGGITGFLLSVLFNVYAPALFGPDTLLYTAYRNSAGEYEIPFHICMGLAFAFTVLLMVGMSLAGPRVNPRAFVLDKGMFRVDPTTLTLIVVILLLLSVLYVRFW
jgi:SSS family solute:Na+ symporter